MLSIGLDVTTCIWTMLKPLRDNHNLPLRDWTTIMRTLYIQVDQGFSQNMISLVEGLISVTSGELYIKVACSCE